jgi:sarcosine oxidase subunit gamma
MNRTSPAHPHLPAAAVWETVDGMPVPVRVEARPHTWLVDVSPLRRWLVRGGQAGAWLRGKGLPAPERYFRSEDAGEGAFIVRTGAAEYFVHDGSGAPLAAALGTVPGGVVDGMRVATRDDLEVVLGGVQAPRILSEICALDLERVAGEFLFTRAAGISVWLCVEEGAPGPRYRIGCDPSYGAYLFECLSLLVGEQGGGVIGFHDFQLLHKED